MTMELLLQNWALAAASVLGTAIGLFVLHRAWSDSRHGRLRSSARVLLKCQHAANAAKRREQRAVEKLAALRGRADSVRPRVLSEAEETVQDASMLRKIADDQVLVARKAVREVIVEEFPPKRQDILRNRYL